MSLRCSLLGHSYGEAEIEREREEQGSEVVVTVREFEECERCGDRKVVTENKEVTALDSPTPDLESAESSAGASAGAGGGADTNAESDVSVAPEASASPDVGVDAPADGDDAEIIGGSSDSDESSESVASSASTSADATDTATDTADDFDSSQSAADDDGVILDDDDEDPTEGDRTPGEWPDAETTHPAETERSGSGEWPAVGREDEGYDAEPDDGSNADVEFGGGLTPESASGVADDETEEVEFVNADGDTLRAQDGAERTTELSSGISAGAEAPSLSGPADGPDVDAEFVCPECDYRASVAGSSLRAGDICPECARGYLAQE
ncbi:oxidoreductase [Halorussus sp. MSC15.2]|uniref:DUF7093 family protein n=1 Tax=Halorussus sp. MSC15.2 TaxID=2283638 RepID=UPI0013D2529A|nr:oxidoreductase [Halorussus sp. MSC15.2]NEU57933.1 oxidoreductase [Halorussus sp. MSC15.2]